MRWGVGAHKQAITQQTGLRRLPVAAGDGLANGDLGQAQAEILAQGGDRFWVQLLESNDIALNISFLERILHYNDEKLV